jgi:hypothetical protein
MEIQFSGQVPKDKLAPDTIEDYYCHDNQKDLVAISDGASESYDSKTFARIICEKYKRRPFINLDSNWIQAIIDEFCSTIDIPSLTWSKEAAYKRGSFATLLALRESNARNHHVKIIGIGDSLAVLLDGDIYKDSFPYQESSKFQQRPQLISTNLSQNKYFLDKRWFKENHYRQWGLSNYSNPIILCMTDALGEWTLRNAELGQPKWASLLKIKEVSELEALVIAEWENKNMRKDDITLIRVSFSSWIADVLSIT